MSSKGINVLFIYPNTFGMNMLPPAIAMFTAILKKEGHNIDIFDTTYYSVDHGIDSDGSKMEKLNVAPYSMNEKGIEDMNEVTIAQVEEWVTNHFEAYY